MAEHDQQETGEEALLHFFDLCRNVAAFTEEYEFEGKKMRSPLMNFLSMLDERVQRRPPRSFGLAHRKKTDEIICKSFYIENDYVEPLASSLSLSQHVRKIDLARTKLSKENCRTLILHMP